MSKKRHDRCLMYKSGKQGEVLWPGPAMEFVSEDGELVVADSGPEAEVGLRILFATFLDPRLNFLDREEQFALDLVELLQTECMPTSEQIDASQQILRSLAATMSIELDFDLSLRFQIKSLQVQKKTKIAEIEAVGACKKLLAGDATEEEEVVLLPVREVIRLLHLDDSDTPSEDERQAANMRLICALYERPTGSRIDPATISLSLIRLYFALAHAQRESSEHNQHVEPKLSHLGWCPVCELANDAVNYAKSAIDKANSGESSQVSADFIHMGMTLGTLAAQLGEYRFVIGEERIRGTAKAIEKRWEGKEELDKEQEAYIAKLLSERPHLQKKVIDFRVHKRFNIPIPTAKRRRIDLEKK